MKCPNCSASFDIPEQSSTAVCPYCSTTVQVRTGEVFKENYMMRLQFSLEQAKVKMLSWAMKQLGAPKDLEECAEIQESGLIFWPFWVVEVEADADYTGLQKKPNFKPGRDEASQLGWKKIPEDGHLDMERDIFVPATSNVPEHFQDYVIPTKRKEYFDNDVILEVRGQLRPVHVERQSALEKARVRMKQLLMEEAHKEVDEVQEFQSELDIPAVFLVNVPVWHIKYKYSLRTYSALVDGASGRVIYMEFPRKVAFRAMTLTGGLLHLIVGGGISLALVYYGLVFSDMIYPLVFGVVFGFGMLVYALKFFGTALTTSGEKEIAG